ncbi:MAG: class I SAM-dependent methyltransferase [Pseudomonadota bacterium]
MVSYLPEASWLWQGESYSLARCAHCGTAFSDPIPPTPVLDEFYSRFFDYRWYRDHYKAKLVDARMRVAEYEPWLQAGRILDYGGGMGYLSQAFREAGKESLTFDPYAGTEPPSGRWDAVVSLHALEHANDPSAMIEKMKSFMRPGGKLLLAVPNFESQGYRQLGMRWVWAQPPVVHVFHFTYKGLAALLRRHGFSVSHIEYADRWDANIYADIVGPAWHRWAEDMWGIQPFNRLGAYRRLAAQLNSTRRYWSLSRSYKLVRSPEDKAELQIVASLEI